MYGLGAGGQRGVVEGDACGYSPLCRPPSMELLGSSCCALVLASVSGSLRMLESDC